MESTVQHPGAVRYYFLLVRAENLPRTDLIGGSDPQIDIYWQNINGEQEKVGSTEPILKTRNPLWNQMFTVENALEPVTFHLGDLDGKTINKVGVASCEFINCTEGEEIALPFVFEKEKFQRKYSDARLYIKMIRIMQSLETMSQQQTIKQIENNIVGNTLYSDFPDQEALKLKSTFENNSPKITVLENDYDWGYSSSIFVDMRYKREENDTVKRIFFKPKESPYVVAEVGLERNLVDINPERLQIDCYAYDDVSTIDLGKIGDSYGLTKLNKTYSELKSTLKSDKINFDDKNKIITMSLFPHLPRSFILALDYNYKGISDWKGHHNEIHFKKKGKQNKNHCPIIKILYVSKNANDLSIQFKIKDCDAINVQKRFSPAICYPVYNKEAFGDFDEDYEIDLDDGLFAFKEIALVDVDDDVLLTDVIVTMGSLRKRKTTEYDDYVVLI